MWIILKESARQINLNAVSEILIRDEVVGEVRNVGISVRNLESAEEMFIETKDRTNAERAYASFTNAIRQKLDSVDLTNVK